LAEPVRLVVWDLDETLWKGTLTEGGIEIIPANFALIRTLAERGIVSSICSKNDHGTVERILSEAGI
jgi:predicted enzyme involved in methoxymalonyl-ACP biosynthesis